jgi:YbbR domain-containing protein
VISMEQFKNWLTDWVIDNGTYKIVALFITLSLWVFIFEKQIAVVSKSIKVEFILAPQHVITNKVVREVQFKVRGPRMGLKKFLDNADSINVDLSNAGPGKTTVRIYDDILQLPTAVDVVSVQPTHIYVEIEKKNPDEVNATDANNFGKSSEKASGESEEQAHGQE